MSDPTQVTTPHLITLTPPPARGVLRRAVSSSIVRTRRLNFESRFWKRVERTASCWLWLGGTDMRGNGLVKFGKNKITRKARRVAYELICGPIPPGKNVSRGCDNIACVNPAHLVIRTQRETLQANSGKLTSTEVKEILFLRKLGVTYRQIAIEKGLNISSVSAILNGRVWENVTGLDRSAILARRKSRRRRSSRAGLLRVWNVENVSP